MLTPRLAAAIGLLMALLTSQLPEFTQQYRQRLGGAIDELRKSVANFDADAARHTLDRDAAIARLAGNSDVLARDQAAEVESTVARLARLDAQAEAFSTSGPVSQLFVFLGNVDPGIAASAYAAYQPAVPVTSAGLLAGLAGLVGGWGLTHLAAWPLRRLGRKRRARILEV